MKAAIDYIVDWASDSNWKKYLVNKVVKDEIDDEVLLSELIDLIVKKEGVALRLIKQTQDENDLRLVIKEIKRPVNINALSSDTSFSLGNKLNVFYGENGSGKSSYVRVFRKLANNYHTSAKELKLLPNIYLLNAKNQASTKRQTIDVSYSCNEILNKLEEIDINLEHGELMQINVFDSESVVPLLNSNLTFSVLPQGFLYFNKIVVVLDSLRTKVDGMVVKEREKQKAIFSDTSNDIIKSEIADIIQKVKGFNKIKEFINKTYPIDENIETLLADLQTKISELEGSNISDKLKILRAQKSKLESLVTSISALATKLSLENIQAVNGLIEEYSNNIQEEKKQNEAFAKNISFLGHINEEWYSVIRSSKDYYKSLSLDGPNIGDRCILCSQEMKQNEINIVSSSMVHVCSDLHSDNEKLKQKLELSKVNEIIIFKKEDEELFEKVKLVERIIAIISLLKSNVDLFNNNLIASSKIGQVTVDFSDITKDIKDEYTDLEERIQTLSKSTKEMVDICNAYKVKRSALVKAKMVHESLDNLKQHYSHEEYIQTLTSIKSGFATTQLTRKAKDAFKSIVEDSYINTFNEYCNDLKVGEVKIKLTPQRGQTQRSKFVVDENYKVTDIMSEGEQKAIALAEFATDITIRRNFNTILFDDPVTSLDYKRSELFAKLIYKLSKERQVIVFTHNIMFYYYLYNECAINKDKENKFFMVDQYDKDNKGIITESFSGRLENLSEVTKKLKQYEQKINSKSCTGDELEESLKAAYSNIRTWCELIIEEGFFKDLIKRYEPNIRFTVIKKINTDFIGELETVAELFDKACRWMLGHSQPTETQNSKATREDFIKDFTYIVSITETFKAR